jgi:hypothetical protein
MNTAQRAMVDLLAHCCLTILGSPPPGESTGEERAAAPKVLKIAPTVFALEIVGCTLLTLVKMGEMTNNDRVSVG